MSDKTPMNMVHESEAQRQYARVRLPAILHFVGPGGEEHRCELHDLSAGGFRIQESALSLAAGDQCTATLCFSVGTIDLSLPVRFQVRWQDRDSGDTGCEFERMEPRQVAVLRHLITSFLSGELVSVDDTLDILARDNFTRPRRKRTGEERSGLLHRVRPVFLSLVFFGVGLVAFVLVCGRLYDLYFVGHAQSATVTARTYTVTMPRDGILESVVGGDGQVGQGEPLALFRSSLLDLVRGSLRGDLPAPGTVEQLLRKTLKGTITSPCNCRIQEQLVADGQFAARGQEIFRLVDVDAQPFVMARFPFSRGGRIAPGDPVRLRIAGQAGELSGRVARVMSPSVAESGTDSVLVRIVPDQPIAARFIGRPVQVSIGGLAPGTLAGSILTGTALAGKW